MRRFVTPTEAEFIRQNYPTRGSKYCEDALQMSHVKIQRYANEYLKIRLVPGMQSEVTRIWATDYFKDSGDIRMEEFTDVTSPSVAYFLGFLWADGHVEKIKNRIGIKVRLDDGQAILPILNAVGTFHTTIRPASTGKRRNKAALEMRISNASLKAFLVKYGYLAKSGGSPVAILTHLPERLRRYWWRGYFDGDGTVGLHKRTNGIQLASTFDQDWTFAEALMAELGIKRFGVSKLVNRKGHKASVFRVQNMIDMERMLEYIYEGFEVDRLGLQRKYDRLVALRAKMIESPYHHNRAAVAAA